MTQAIAYPFLKRRNNPYKLVQLYTRDIAKGPCSLNKMYKPPVGKKNSNLILIHTKNYVVFVFIFLQQWTTIQ